MTVHKQDRERAALIDTPGDEYEEKYQPEWIETGDVAASFVCKVSTLRSWNRVAIECANHRQETEARIVAFFRAQAAVAASFQTAPETQRLVAGMLQEAADAIERGEHLTWRV